MPFAPVTFTDGVTPLNKATFDALQAGVIAAERAENKAVANGYPSLDSGIKVPVAQLPAGTANGVASLDGAGKVPMSQLALSPASVGLPQVSFGPIASGPPTPLFNGDLWYATDVGGSGSGIVWAFRYNGPSASAYKWEFIGGAPWVGSQPVPQTLGATNTWINLGPTTFSIPRNGEYLVRAAASCLTGSSATSSAYLAVYANTAGNVLVSSVATQVANWNVVLACPATKYAAASGAAIGMSGFGLSGSQFLAGMSWEVLPVRVS